jgi:hypothetical protein
MERELVGMRKVLAGAIAVLTAFLVAGCVSFVSNPTTSQQGTIGPLQVHVSVCPDTTLGCSDQTQTSDAPSQLLVAALVPNGASAPSSFSAPVTISGSVKDLEGNSLSSVKFNQNADYGAAVEEADPAAAGMKWVGYNTEYIVFDQNNENALLTLTTTAQFGLPGSNGAPKSTFVYQLEIGGWEWYTNGSGQVTPPTPVYSCGPADGDDLVGPYYVPGGSSPPSSGTAYFEGSCSLLQYPTNSPGTVNLRNAAVIGGKTVSAGKGKTAKLSFTFDYVGSKPGKSFTLSASSGKVSTKSIKPSGKTSKKVTVTVHTSKHSGTYRITLTAKYPGGQVRRGTDKLKVH